MQITRPDDHAILLSQLDALLIELLRRIPESADPNDNDAARARLFSAPTNDPKEETLREDWENYVAPELEKLFRSTLGVVTADLGQLQVDPKSGAGQLRIPIDHLEQWIHGLNQARLAIAARFDFSDDDMENPLPIAGDPRSTALLQVRFYGFLQELFLRELEGD